MNVRAIALSFVMICSSLMFSNDVNAQVTTSASDGFQIKIVKTTEADASVTYACLVKNISKWWDPDHTYSGKSENFSMDLEKNCLYEQLPNGGFVRHMEIVYCQPGKSLRLTGGLGPLQGMGVAGAMTFNLVPEGDKTNLELTYNVSGADALNLDKIAPAVESVLNGQMDRLREYCDQSKGK